MEENDNNNKLFISQLSNSVSTSGAGHSFEVEAQTLFAILMLAHGRVPGFPDSEIVEIDQQTRVNRWNIDDFMLVLQDRHSSNRHKVLFQAKLSFKIGDNDDFREIVKGAYSDYCDPRFDKARDALVLFCGKVSGTDLGLLASVYDLAGTQKSAESFFSKVRASRYKSEQFGKTVQVIEEEIKKSNPTATEEEVYSFLRCFRIWNVDLQHRDGFVLAIMNSFIAKAAPNMFPHQIWSAVYEVMDYRNRCSGETGIEDFPDEIRKSFTDDKRQEMPEQFSVERQSSSSRFASLLGNIQKHDYYRDFCIALLIGGWNEKNWKDISFIETLVRKDYDVWKRNLIALYHEFEGIITFRDGQWNILHRKELFPLIKWDFYRESLDAFEGESIKLLLGNDVEQDSASSSGTARDRFAVCDYSVILRDHVAVSLAIMGNVSNSQDDDLCFKLNAIAHAVVNEVLHDADVGDWERLGRNLGELAEAAPDVFFNAVEETFCKQDDTSRQSQEKDDFEEIIGVGCYASDILSALDRLVWVDSFFERAADIMFRLIDSDPDKFKGASSLHALARILLPWHPQTFASAERRKSIMDRFIEGKPESSWALLLSLLPKSHSTTMNTARPKYLNCSSDDYQIKVTISEFWDVSNHYLSLAMKMAKNNLSNIIQLFDYFSDMPVNFQKELLTLSCSDAILHLPEEEHIPLWSKLTRLCARHRTYSYAKWALPEETLKLVDSVIEQIKPQKKALRFLPLFSRSCGDYFPHESGNRVSYQKKIEHISDLQDEAARSILREDGVEGILDFAKTIENVNRLGYSTANVCLDVEAQSILDSCLAANDAQIKAFLSVFIARKHQKCAKTWIDGISRENWTPEQTAAFLCALYPVTSYVLTLKSYWLKDCESLYWENYDLPFASMIDKDCFYTVIDSLLLAGRPDKAIDLLGQLRYVEYPFDAHRAVNALALASARDYKIDIHDVAGQNYLSVLCLIQDSEEISDDDKLSMEWKNIEYLSHAYKDGLPLPKYIYKKMSLSPDYFCKILNYAYNKCDTADISGDVTLSDEHVVVDNQIVLGLLWNWRLIPEFYFRDNQFYSPLFEQWFNAVVRIARETGHYEATLANIGEALVSTPEEPDGSLWINKGIARLIDKIENKGLREGYRNGYCDLRNTRSDEDLKLIEELNKKAEALNTFGCPRFADLLRDIVKDIKANGRPFRIFEEE